MSEGEAYLALKGFTEQQERVSLILHDDVWTISWFSLKGGYSYMENPDLITLIEEITK